MRSYFVASDRRHSSLELIAFQIAAQYFPDTNSQFYTDETIRKNVLIHKHFRLRLWEFIAGLLQLNATEIFMFMSRFIGHKPLASTFWVIR